VDFFSAENFFYLFFFGYFDAMAAVETKPGGICGKLSDGKNEFILVYWAWLGLKLLGLN